MPLIVNESGNSHVSSGCKKSRHGENNNNNNSVSRMDVLFVFLLCALVLYHFLVQRRPRARQKKSLSEEENWFVKVDNRADTYNVFIKYESTESGKKASAIIDFLRIIPGKSASYSEKLPPSYLNSICISEVLVYHRNSTLNNNVEPVARLVGPFCSHSNYFRITGWPYTPGTSPTGPVNITHVSPIPA